jgi:hypothetical protein
MRHLTTEERRRINSSKSLEELRDGLKVIKRRLDALEALSNL